MSDTDILAILKANLEIRNTIKDDYLAQLITVSVSEIKREGITLSDPYTLEDANLIAMYAAYLYRKRATNEEQYQTVSFGMNGMPRMLRYALNQRLMSQKMGGQS